MAELIVKVVKMGFFMDEQKSWKSKTAVDEQYISRLSRTIKKLPTGCALIQGAEHWELVKGNEEFFRLIGYTEEEIQVLQIGRAHV